MEIITERNAWRTLIRTENTAPQRTTQRLVRAEALHSEIITHKFLFKGQSSRTETGSFWPTPYLYTLLSRCLCSCVGGRLPDRPRRAEWHRAPGRRRSRRGRARRTERSRGGRANTPSALCLGRSSRDSRARRRPRGGSDTPHSLHREDGFSAPPTGRTIQRNSGKLR